MSLFTSAKWRVLRYLLCAALLTAGGGSAGNGSDNGRVFNGEVGSTEAAKLSASNCIDDFSDDDTEYCIILTIDDRVPTVSGGMISPTTFTGFYYELLPGEHHITLRNRLEEPREIIELSFVAQSGHWYSVMAKSRKFPEWRFYVYDDTAGAVIAHIGDRQ